MSTTKSAETNWLPAIAATLAMVLVSMDLFMMPIATTALVNELNTDAAMVQAVIALFSLVFAGLCILGGKLGDIFGKKKVFVAGIVLYGVAALITALAPTMLVVILGFSIVRAVAVALAIPASVTLIVANYEDEAKRGTAFAIYGVGAMLAGLIAPLLMGFMADKVSWRVPFVLDALIAGLAFFLARPMRETEIIKSKVDGFGTVLAFLAIGAVILGGMLGGAYGWWDARRPFVIGDLTFNPLNLSPTALLFGAGILLTAWLLNHGYRTEERGGAPLFSLRLFDNRTFAVTFVMAVIFFLLNGALPFIVPVFLQEAVGFDGAKTGSVMTGFMLGSLVSSLASGQLVHRLQPRHLMQLAMIVIVVGFVWLFVSSTLTMTVWDGALPMLVVGLGFGVVVTQIPNVQLSSLSADLQGEGSGLAETAKEVGVGLGTAVIGSVMFGLVLGGMVDKVAKEVDIELTPQERAELIIQSEDEKVPKELEQMIAERVPNLGELTREAYVEAFQITLGTLVGIVLLALLVASFIPWVKTEDIDNQKSKAAGKEVGTPA